MFRLFQKVLLVIPMSVMLSSCSWNDTEPESVEDKSPVALYEDAQNAMRDQDYKKASEILVALDARYPYGGYSTQVQLDLIYCYYKDEQNVKGIQVADRFIKANPTHKDLDYVYYMRGLILMQQDTDLLHTIFGVDRYDRDPSYAKEAFRDFNFIITLMPNSKYAPDAKIRMLSLKNRLARQELAVAQYYYDRRAYIAAANRGKKFLDSFYDTKYAEQILEIMINSYSRLKLTDMENEARNLMSLNFPENRMALR